MGLVAILEDLEDKHIFIYNRSVFSFEQISNNLHVRVDAIGPTVLANNFSVRAEPFPGFNQY